jgi:tyrosyl-tRNA synthetase
VRTGLVKSKGEARRVILSGGVKINGRVVKDVNAAYSVRGEGMLIQKGKRHFVKVVLGI